MASVAVEPQQNVVSRVASLPLVSSTYGMMSSAYANTKENHPYLKSVCEVAEKGVLTLTAVAMTSTKPVLQKLEPQIAAANNFACIGLDKLEEKLPILHQPSDQQKKLQMWKDLKLGLRSRTIMLDWGSLSSKLQKRACQQAVAWVRDAKCGSQEAISQLHHTVDLMEYARQNMTGANQKLQDAQQKLYQSWLEWSKSIGQSDGEQCNSTEDIESRTLTMARSLTKHLQTTCITLVSSLHGLPQNIQEQAVHVSTMAGDLYQHFHLASSREGSEHLLATSEGQLNKMKGSLDNMVDYVVNHTPLNWLVGPFYPQLGGSNHAEQEGGDTARRTNSPLAKLHKGHFNTK